MKKTINEISKEIVKEIKKPIKKDIVHYISSGSPLLDLMLGGGYAKGRMVNIVGDKSTGKTLLAAEFLASNTIKLKKKFNHIYDDPEAGFNFNTKDIYGVEIYNEDYKHSDTVEKFEYNIEKQISKVKEDETFVYVLDSFDAIGSEAETKKYKQKINALKKKIEQTEDSSDKKLKGEYGMDKQKEIGKFFRITCRKMRQKNIILFLISQVRENIGVMFGEKYLRAGGKALDFYASQINWLSEVEKIKKFDTAIGIRIKVRNKKNKVGKPFRECFLDILFDYGIDNLTSNINYLYDLVGSKGEYKARKIIWDEVEYTPAGLLKYIEENNLEEELIKRITKKWNDFEDEISTKNRKKKW